MDLLDKIKYALMVIGVIALIALFYMTNKKIKINSLYKIIEKTYKAKIEAAQKRIDALKKASEDQEEVSQEIKDELELLEKEKEETSTTIKDLNDKDLTDAISEWFKRNKK